MERQHLTERAPREQALAVVSDIAGLHAQVASSAELTLWARVEGLQRGEVDELLWERRLLVKTWAMRGTLHLLPSAELPRYVGALARLRPRHHVAAWLRHHGLERDQAEAMLAAIADALRGGAQLTREELAATVAERVGEPALGDRLKGGFGDLLKPAAFTGDLCFAPSDGQRVRFTRPGDWLGGWEPVDGEQAARDVVRTYLRAYGPAPREQFQRWFGMTSPAEAGRWIKAPRRRGGRGRGGGRAWLDARRRRGRRRPRPARGRRPAAARLRPLRRRRAARRGRRATGRAPRARLPAARVAFAGTARRRPHRGCLEA
jgi:hypothetical protein